jgi:hypothetical protein
MFVVFMKFQRDQSQRLLDQKQLKGFTRELSEKKGTISKRDLARASAEFLRPQLEQLQKGLEVTPGLLEELDTDQKHIFRASIVKALKELTSVELDYPVWKDPTKLDAGDKVEVEGHDGVGVIERFIEDGVQVYFDGCGNCHDYPLGRLSPAASKEDLDALEASNQRALELSGQTFTQFEEEMKRQLKDAIERGTLQVTKPSQKFKKGDRIRMTASATGRYTQSKEGSEGDVLEFEGCDQYEVRFTKLTGDPSLGVRVYHDIYGRDMELLVPPEEMKPDPESLLRSAVKNAAQKILNGQMEAFLQDELVRDLTVQGLLLPSNSTDEFLIHQLKLFEMMGPGLTAAYADPLLYSSPDQFSPPSERKPHVLRLELTQGCNYAKCTFCTGYQGIRYKARSFGEFQAHFRAVMKAIGDEARNIRRIFIGGGNALDVDEETLKKVIGHVRDYFYVNHSIRRLSIYGRTDAMVAKGRSGMGRLRNVGLNLIYWGGETGAQDILDYVDKGVTVERILLGGFMANAAGLELSIMLMPGLGGMRYADAHVEGTIRLLNELNLKYVTFMAVNPAAESRYTRRMQAETAEGINRPLNEREIVEQVKAILGGVSTRDQKIGMYNCTIDEVGSNPVSFNVRFDEYGKRDALKACDAYLKAGS